MMIVSLPVVLLFYSWSGYRHAARHCQDSRPLRGAGRPIYRLAGKYRQEIRRIVATTGVREGGHPGVGQSDHARLQHPDRARIRVDLDINAERNGELLVDVTDHAAAECRNSQRGDMLGEHFFHGE